MALPNSMELHLDSTTHIPIAQLTPLLSAPETRAVKAIVTLTWPYSSAAGSVAFLLAEPDFRLRKTRGQVRVQFSGSSARSVAKAGIASGDTVLLCLDGVEWIREEEVLTPGRGVEFEMKFTERLLLQFQQEDSMAIGSIDIDHPDPEPEQSPSPETAPSPAISSKSPSIYAVTNNAAEEKTEWASPAFLKRARTSYGSLFADDYDPFDEEDGTVRGKGRKKTRLSATWTYKSRSPTPESEGGDDERVENALEGTTNSSMMVDHEAQTTGIEIEDAAEALAGFARQAISVDKSAQPGNQVDLDIMHQNPVAIRMQSPSPSRAVPALSTPQVEALPTPSQNEPRPPLSPRLVPLSSDGLPLVSPLVPWSSGQLDSNRNESPIFSYDQTPSRIRLPDNKDGLATDSLSHHEEISSNPPYSRKLAATDDQGEERQSTSPVIQQPTEWDLRGQEDERIESNHGEPHGMMLSRAEASYSMYPDMGDGVFGENRENEPLISHDQALAYPDLSVPEELTSNQNSSDEINLRTSEAKSLPFVAEQEHAQDQEPKNEWSSIEVPFPDRDYLYRNLFLPEPPRDMDSTRRSYATGPSEIDLTTNSFESRDNGNEEIQDLQQKQSRSGDNEQSDQAEDDDLLQAREHRSNQDLLEDHRRTAAEGDESLGPGDGNATLFDGRALEERADESDEDEDDSESQPSHGHEEETSANSIDVEEQASIQPHGTSLSNFLRLDDEEFSEESNEGSVMAEPPVKLYISDGEGSYEYDEEEVEYDEEEEEYDEVEEEGTEQDSPVKVTSNPPVIDLISSDEEEDVEEDEEEDEQEGRPADETDTSRAGETLAKGDFAKEHVSEDYSTKEVLHSMSAKVPYAERTEIRTATLTQHELESSDSDEEDGSPDEHEARLQSDEDDMEEQSGEISEQASQANERSIGDIDQTHQDDMGQIDNKVELVKADVEEEGSKPEARLSDAHQTDTEIEMFVVEEDEAGPMSENLANSQENGNQANGEAVVGGPQALPDVGEDKQASAKQASNNRELFGLDGPSDDRSPEALRSGKHESKQVQLPTPDDSQLSFKIQSQVGFSFTSRETVLSDSQDTKEHGRPGSKDYQSSEEHDTELKDKNYDQAETETTLQLEPTLDQAQLLAENIAAAKSDMMDVENHESSNIEQSTSQIGVLNLKGVNDFEISEENPKAEHEHAEEADNRLRVPVPSVSAGESDETPKATPRRSRRIEESCEQASELTHAVSATTPTKSHKIIEPQSDQSESLVVDLLNRQETPEGDDPSIEMALETLDSSPKHDLRNSAVVDPRVLILRTLRNDLAKFCTLKMIRYKLEKPIDILAVATAKSTEPRRARAGPRHFQVTFNITDPSVGPSSVAEVQVFRPHVEALPIVNVGDVVLLRNFVPVSVQKKGFVLRSQIDACAWAVFKEGADAPEMRGPPVEYGEVEVKLAIQSREWFQNLDEIASAKLQKANVKISGA